MNKTNLRPLNPSYLIIGSFFGIIIGTFGFTEGLVILSQIGLLAISGSTAVLTRGSLFSLSQKTDLRALVIYTIISGVVFLLSLNSQNFGTPLQIYFFGLLVGWISSDLSENLVFSKNRQKER